MAMEMVMGMVMDHMATAVDTEEARVIPVVGRVNIRTIRMGTQGMMRTTDTRDTIIRMAETVITTVAICIRYMSHLHSMVTVIIENVVAYTKNIFIFYAANAK